MYASYSNQNNNCTNKLGNAIVYDNNKIWYVKHGRYTIRCSIDPITNRIIQQRVNNQSSVKKYADDYVHWLFTQNEKEKIEERENEKKEKEETKNKK